MADKINISSFQIAASKMRADGNAYFKLFEKHIPVGYGENSTILLYKIDNMSCIAKIVDMNNSSKYIVVTNDATAAALRIVLNKSINVDYLKDFDFEKNDMKFDCIIMNPPYSRNLHLKILAEAIKHLKDEKSVVANLSPVRWLQDPLAKYKKNCDLKRFEESVAKHIKSLETITSDVSNTMFNAGIMSDLGIYVCNSYIYGEYKKYFTNNIIDKIFAKQTNMFANVLEYKKRNGWRWQISELQPINAQGGAKGTYGWYRRFCIFNHLRSTVYFDGQSNGKDWTIFTSGVSNDESGKALIPWSIKFNTEIEAINCENSTKTTLYKYYILNIKSDQHTPFKYIPFLGDAINPRTGLKGYTGEWTDDDLVLYFNITPEEQKIIEDTIEKYK